MPANGLNPIYDEEPFIFKKVVLPDLASLRVAAFEENGKFIGTRILPIVGLRPGYRHISLRNESLQPLTLPTLFVHITVQDYIPDSLFELADALANPIAYQTMIEKHDKQLLALTDEGEDSTANTISNNIFNDSNSLVSSKNKISPGHLNESEEKSIAQEMSQLELNAQQSKTITTTSTGPSSTTSASPNLNNNSYDVAGKNEQNGGNVSSRNSSKVASPSHKQSIKRQETINRKMASSLKSHDESSFERIVSLLESEEGNLTAETIDKLKMNKNVQKVFAKLEKELQSLQKKVDKSKEKVKELYVQEEERAMQYLEKQRKIATSSSKGTKKGVEK